MEQVQLGCQNSSGIYDGVVVVVVVVNGNGNDGSCD
jgi:hypothetical protein